MIAKKWKLCYNTRMKNINEIKDDIIEALYSNSAYQLPSICESIGLASGTGEEAFKSKRNYVASRLHDFDMKGIRLLLKALKEKQGIDLYPIKNYSYKLSNVTKRDLANLLYGGYEKDEGLFFPSTLYKMSWSGLMDEWVFIEKTCNLQNIVPLKGYSTFKDEYWQHRVRNNDYDDDWFFTDPRFLFKSGTDKALLDAVCYMFHPEVRNEKEPWGTILEQVNKLIEPDGFEIYAASKMSGRNCYAWRKIVEDFCVTSSFNEEIKNILSSDYVNSQIQLMNDSIENNPHVAIGKAKELLETISKKILTDENIEYASDEKLTSLDKKVRKLLNLSVDENSSQIPGVKQILGGLAGISSGMSELRNSYGDGHGRVVNFKTLPSRYAKLAVGVASTYVLFLLETYAYYKSNKAS